MKYLIIAAIIIFIIYRITKSRSDNQSKPKNKKTFHPTIEKMAFPDRTDTVNRNSNAILEGFSTENMDLVNLSYAKLIESIRQQNVNTIGDYEQVLGDVRAEYSKFRLAFGYDYPPQFLPPTERSKPEIKKNDSSKINEPSNLNKLRTLIKELNSRGHHDFPLLRQEYSTNSGMPYKDFSDWVIAQLKEKDYDSLYDFVREFYPSDDEYSDKELGKNFKKFLTKKIGVLFKTIDEQAIFEIQAFFILTKSIDDFNREFWISDENESILLAKILSLYSFSPNKSEFEPLIKKANKFLSEVRKDTDYWDDHPNYKPSEIKDEYGIPEDSILVSLLQQLTLGERLHFFDFAIIYSNQKFWNRNSSYKTRRFGIQEIESVTKMLELGLFNQVSDLSAIPEVTSKSELKEAAEQANFEIKKSWTLAKIYENLLKTNEGQKFLKSFIADKSVLSFNEELRKDLNQILDYQTTIRRIVNLVAMV